MRNKIRVSAALLTAVMLVTFIGCGGNNGAVLPAPAAGSNQVPMPGGGYAVGNCGVPAGGQYPLNPQGVASIGTLTDYAGSPAGYTPGGRANEITINAYSTAPLSAGISSYNVLANGTLTFPDMVTSLPYLAAQGYGLCVSTTAFNGVGGTPGHYVIQDNSLAVTMIGLVPSPYGVGPQTSTSGGVGGQPYAQVEVGYNCGAYMEVGGRITGCVDVTVKRYDPYTSQEYTLGVYPYYAQ